MRKQSVALTATLFLLILATSVSAKDSWISIRSKNFLLVGNANEKEIKQVAVRLEQFRDVFTRLFPKMVFNSPVPTTVIVFKNDSSYRPFKPGMNAAGYFQAGQDVNYITLTTEARGEQDPFTVIFHEYTHLLVGNTIGNAPIWFNEGLAEYYSTFSISDDQKVVLGKPISGHVYLLRENKMLPLRTLFQVDSKSPHYNERNKQGIFYAESWALMHYLIIGKEGRLAQVSNFVEQIIAGVPMEQAFQQAFQMSFEAMEKELKDYVRQDRYHIVEGHFEHKLETDAALQATPITEAEAQAYLGDLLLHIHSKDCETYLQKALELDPNCALAHAALGVAKIRDGKPDEARKNLEQAVAADSKNYLIHYYYAYVLSRSGGDDSQPVVAYSPEVAKQINDELHQVIKMRPDFPEAYSLFAFVSLVTGNNLQESANLLKRAVIASPGRNDLVFMLAQIDLRNGDYKTSRQLLEQVTRSNAPDEVQQHAKALLAQVVSFQERNERFEAAKKSDTKTETESQSVPFVSAERTQTQNPQPSDPSKYLREVLRKPQEGETQQQGVLLRIDCDAKGIVFQVKVGEQMLKLRTTSFDDIELTTYDPDVNGQIKCGISKSEAHVVVCFIPPADKKPTAQGVLKSIEFVPKDFKLKP